MNFWYLFSSQLLSDNSNCFLDWETTQITQYCYNCASKAYHVKHINCWLSQLLPQNGLPSILIISRKSGDDRPWRRCSLMISSATGKMSTAKPFSGTATLLTSTYCLHTPNIISLMAFIWFVLRRTWVSEDFFRKRWKKSKIIILNWCSTTARSLS